MSHTIYCFKNQEVNTRQLAIEIFSRPVMVYTSSSFIIQNISKQQSSEKKKKKSMEQRMGRTVQNITRQEDHPYSGAPQGHCALWGLLHMVSQMWREVGFRSVSTTHPLTRPAWATPFRFTWWWFYDSEDPTFLYDKCGFCSPLPTIYITMFTHFLLQLEQEVMESNSSSSLYLRGGNDFLVFTSSADAASWRRNQPPCSSVFVRHRGQPSRDEPLHNGTCPQILSYLFPSSPEKLLL